MVCNMFTVSKSLILILLVNSYTLHAFFSNSNGRCQFTRSLQSVRRVSYQKLHQSDQKSEQNEVFSEDDNILSGEPKWFKTSLQDTLSDSSVDVFDKGVILRTLPLYLLYDENCFPTGNLPLVIDSQYVTMMDDIAKTDNMFGVVMSDGKGQFCEVGTAVENIRQSAFRGGRQLENVCRQRFRILKIIQVEPYLIADVEYGISDIDVLTAESTVQDLPETITYLEKEIYQILFDVIALTNKLFEEEESADRSIPVLEISDAVKYLSPQNHFFRGSVATDFSFAVCDMIGASARLKQILLETRNLEVRLNKIKKALVNARSYLIDRVDAYEEPFN